MDNNNEINNINPTEPNKLGYEQENSEFASEIIRIKNRLARVETEIVNLKDNIQSIHEEEEFEEEDDEEDDDELQCPHCHSLNIHIQYVRKGMSVQGTLLFLGLLCGGLTIPLAIWYWYDCNKLREYNVCKNCGKIWQE